MRLDKRKVLACLMSLVLVFSMTSAAALTAFADQLAAGTLATQTSGNKIVYDTVYGVIGTESGDYALMTKTVTYEAQYRNIPNYQYRATITDLVKSDGSVAFHSNTALLEHQELVEKVAGEGAAADYRMLATRGSITEGYVTIADKSTGKVGMKKLDGTDFIPCSYDSLVKTPAGDLAGVVLEGSKVKVSFMDSTGAPIGSFEYPAANDTGDHAAFIMYAGEYIQIGMRIDQEFYTGYAKKVGGQYVQATDVTSIIQGNGTLSAVVVKTDGNVYYCENGKADVKLGPNEGFESAWVSGSLLTLQRFGDEGESDYQVKYLTDGTKVTADPDDIWIWLDKTYAGLWETGDPYTGQDYDSSYAVFDYTGKLIKKVAGDRLQGIGDPNHFATITDVRYDEENDWSFLDGTLNIWDGAGNLVKNLGRIFGEMTLESKGTYDENGNRVIVGYTLPANSSPTGKEVYYDTDFNVVESLPDTETATTQNELKLADGTVVHATVDSWWANDVQAYVHSSSVTDDAGKPIVLGGKMLAISIDVGTYVHWNSVKHGNSDVWWAKDSNGKVGAVDSTGKTVIDFKYEAAFDLGESNTDYALVRENGEWMFIKVAGSDVGKTTPVAYGEKPGPGPVDPDNPGVNYSETDRLSGDKALDTMSSIVDKGNFDKNGTVVLTTSEGYWDALTAAGIAGMTKAPVLMTNDKSLSPQTADQLKKLTPKTIIVCGGKKALDPKVADAAQKASGAEEVIRCSGDNARGTAIDIFEQAMEISGSNWSDTAFVCTSEGYWDALSAAPISYAKAMPIFLTRSEGAFNGVARDELEADTLAAMKKGGVKKVVICGGPAAVSDNVMNLLKREFGANNVDRKYGDTAIETSEAVAGYGLSLGLSADNLGVATNGGYWDALSGAALCGKLGSVIVLVDNENAHSITSFIADNAAQIAEVNIFGGKMVITDATEAAVLNAAK